MNEQSTNGNVSSSADPLEIIDALCNEFEDAWRRGERPSLEQFLERGPDRLHEELFLELVRVERELARLDGKLSGLESYLQRFPQFAGVLRDYFDNLQTAKEIDDSDATDSDTGEAIGSSEICAMPESIGRYEVKRYLGTGKFGCVYLAFDKEADRQVAIKVPHARYMLEPEQVELYRREAKTAARLEATPHVVRLYTVDSTADHPFFIVSQFIDGENLAARLRQHRYTPTEAAQLVATVAEALHHAHIHDVVHRDIKPSNILLDKQGTPYVADFGLALREQELGQGPRFVGTPAYMSPEQARNDGHRVDGRSDIFALGIVLYELLTTRRPFRGSSREELLDDIITRAPRPPRQIDDTIPPELERICLKALAKPLAERYTTAKDMADDLRQFLAEQADGISDRGVPLSASGTAAKTIRTGLVVSLAIATALIAATLFAILLAPWRQPAAVPVSESPAAPQLDVHFQRHDQQGSYQLLTADLLPLYTGDRVQIHAKLYRPMHAVVAAITADGELAMLFPADHAGHGPVTEVHIPPGNDQWLPLAPPAGTETLILITSVSRPVDLTALESELAGFGQPPVLDERALLLADADGPRLLLPGGGSRALGDHVVQSEKGFVDRLLEHAAEKWDHVQVLAFSHESSPTDLVTP